MLQKIKLFFNRIGMWLAFGMKAADEQILHSGSVSDVPDSAVHQEQNEHRVAHHLLKGEVTQEVQELAYRTVAVERESEEYEMYSPFKAVKQQNKRENRKLSIYNPGNLKVLTVQENKPKGDSVLEALSKVDADKVSVDDNGELSHEIGRIEKSHRYTLTVDRNGLFTPRYLIEEYTKKLVCLTVDEAADEYYLDFYVTKYPNDKDFKSKGFVREVEHIKDDMRRSDITDIRGVSFATFHAYRFFDGVSFKFNSLSFIGVYEYDGDYVLRFSANAFENAKDFFDALYSESMAKKYETKAPKELVLNINPYDRSQVRSYTCSMCGKTVFYDPESIDSALASEETETDGDTEFMDLEMSAQTFGKMVCKDCMEKHKAELMAEYLRTNGDKQE